jgi:hypothetical protein
MYLPNQQLYKREISSSLTFDNKCKSLRNPGAIPEGYTSSPRSIQAQSHFRCWFYIPSNVLIICQHSKLEKREYN